MAQWIASSNSFNSAWLRPSITSTLSSGNELSFRGLASRCGRQGLDYESCSRRRSKKNLTATTFIRAEIEVHSARSLYCYGHTESPFKSIACPPPKDVNGQIACEFVDDACSHSI